MTPVRQCFVDAFKFLCPSCNRHRKHSPCLYKNYCQYSPSTSYTPLLIFSPLTSTSKTWTCSCEASVDCGASTTARNCSTCASCRALFVASSPRDYFTPSGLRTPCRASGASWLSSSRRGLATACKPSDMSTGIQVSIHASSPRFFFLIGWDPVHRTSTVRNYRSHCRFGA
jgi:hypothetical protein